MKYNWKDLLVDAAIVAVVLGVLALIIGSFPATFSKFLPFLKQEWISSIHLLVDTVLVGEDENAKVFHFLEELETQLT